MWGSINFNVNEIVSQAIELINKFMPLVYVIGGVAVFGMALLVIVVITRKASGA